VVIPLRATDDEQKSVAPNTNEWLEGDDAHKA
jgi:hypothetical protein